MGKKNIAGNQYPSPIGNINITITGIKEAINQPHKYYHDKNISIYDLPKLLQESKYIGNAPDENRFIKEYHYLEIAIKNESSYFVIKETWQGQKNFYSIVDWLMQKQNG